jgi:hypothetical protein
MALFFFHVQDGRAQDFDGVELPDVDAARKEAVRFAGYLIQQAADTFRPDELWSMRVCNDRGVRYMTLEFSVIDDPFMPA